jgi:hypothetical protein
MPTSLPSWNTAALAVAVLASGRTARRHGARRLAGATEVAGLAAAGLPLDQCVLGLLLSLALAWAAYVTLPVLLIWMADAGAMLARSMR